MKLICTFLITIMFSTALGSAGVYYYQLRWWVIFVPFSILLLYIHEPRSKTRHQIDLKNPTVIINLDNENNA